ncbi:hypothetical protein GLOTRDRAFT_108012 [Gloeophyllum trabeum ATCC 11539]|uniref:Fatty acid desaturase domain-containing protein n=1 Tax=Gloeophyllum trabeum (strain ATCC 11539 / FP-39264 / Madison 617) TaxID=670483 RepID=S7RHB6_GLOTA|nr:uncharacterized protein GLOTRDRAFT_108012 [Gloeophyllum trabeum ATCC 11539]EPQ51969.1 hypothetical protein GLOTRDRAFT_108012 [Gloeophyllum trabeum ATCC 11539]
MQWYQIFQDGPEYEARRQKSTFILSNLALKDVHAAVPKHLFQRDTLKSLYYILQHLAFTYAFYMLGTRIDGFVWSLGKTYAIGPAVGVLLRSVLWVIYWFWQSIAFAGIWCLGHEAGHDALSPYPLFNAVAGISLHTFILVPYYAWRVTHRTHHKSTNNLERDETYIPPTRKDLKLPDGKVAVKMDYKDIIEETPAYTLFKLVVRQLLGYQLYLIHNRKGNPKYPKWTSHYKPSSLIFKPEHHQSIILSDICIASMLTILGVWTYKSGGSFVWKHYWVPWLGTLFALWRSFRQCTFIEDDGDVVFFKNQQGEAVRQVGSAGIADAQ